jgi:hypothetical protein
VIATQLSAVFAQGRHLKYCPVTCACRGQTGVRSGSLALTATTVPAKRCTFLMTAVLIPRGMAVGVYQYLALRGFKAGAK